MFRPLLGAALLLCGTAQAATLRPMSTLSGPTVRLSDLFDGAGAGSDRALGPAPAPGTRIVVESAQLAAIARQFGVAWTPASPGDRAILERPGRPLERDEVVEPLRAALADAGAGTDLDLELPGFSAPMVALEAAVPVTVEQLNYDAPSGRFSAVLGLGGDPTMPQRLRVAGRVQRTEEVMVPVRRLSAGTVLSAADMTTSRVRANMLRGEPVRVAPQAIGMALRHPAMPGQPLLIEELERPMLVTRGARVTMVLDAPGLSVVAQGQAMEAGAAGSQIQVLNPISRAVVVAEVTGPGTVRVAPGSIPLLPGQRTPPPPVVLQ